VRPPGLPLKNGAALHEGYVTWLVEPVLTGNGAPKPRSPAHPALVPLGNDVLGEINWQVRDWYEALFAAFKG
jgi:hypothetical protein